MSDTNGASATAEVSQESSLADWIEYTVINAMAAAEKTSEQIAAANAAIKWVAVKNKIGGDFGAGFDD